MNNEIFEEDIAHFIWIDDDGKVVFNNYHFKLFLEKQGYYKYLLGSNYIVIQITAGIIEIVEPHELKEWLIGLISNTVLKSYIIGKEAFIFADGKMDFLNTFNGKINTDTDTESYHYFLNGFVVVNKNGFLDLHTYSDLQYPIWESQIKNRNFEPIDNLFEFRRSDFFQLSRKITGEKRDRLKSLLSSIGYCCHYYINPSERKATVLIDETHPQDEGRAQGGRGKSLVGKALRGFISNSAWVDGSDLDKKDKATYHNANPDTQLIVIDEVKRGLKLPKLFASITEGITVDKKYKDPFVLYNVKLFMTTNFTLAGYDVSHRRRLNEIEIAPHYNLNHTPKDDFGHNLLEGDWGDNQWKLFDNFMLYCTSFYLRFGLLEYQKVFILDNKIIAETCLEFYDYTGNLEIGTVYNKDKEYDAYLEKFAGFIISKNKFTRWLKLFANIKNWNYTEISAPQNKFKNFILIERGSVLKKPEQIKS